GHGDSVSYYEFGVEYAQLFRRMDFSPLTEEAAWRGGNWWGTEFVRLVSGFVVSIIGPSMKVEYVVFALFGFVGILGFSVAFYRKYQAAASYQYLAWIFLFPSLWFWPSSIGKESLILMGLGLAVCAFVGRRDHINWPLLVGALFLVFAVRPQVAGVLLAALVLAQWLGFKGRWTASRIAQSVLLLIVGIAGISHSMSSIGIEEFDVEGVESYVTDDPSRRTTGGTSVDKVKLGLRGVPVAIANVLFRPFPWEATNPMVLLSSLEVLALWLLVLFRHRQLLTALKSWRSDRLVRLAIAFILLYSIPLGMMLVNVGIIARQRIFLFPFLFLLLEATASRAGEYRRRRFAAGIPVPDSGAFHHEVTTS
ncbi:MAG: hypothetical protein ACREQV_00255, partial [Candidatus Binatia bacterium]